MPHARVVKDKLYRAAVAQHEIMRNALRAITHNQTLSQKTRFQAQMALTSLPISTRPAALQNRCVDTGRARWVLRDFKLTRHRFRELAYAGALPGVRKANW
ncbi:40S ribosomal protein mrp2, mitochondrial [Sorochytrium milnesiophthora]